MTIFKAIEEAKEVLKDTAADAAKYEEAEKALSNKIMPIGAKLYQSASTDSSANDGNSSKGASNGEPVEGEVVDK